MSGGLPVLRLQPDDITRLLSSAAHIGGTQCSAQMMPYVYKCRADGIHILKIDRMWEKLLLAARAVAAVEHAQDVFAVSTRAQGQRAVLKFAHFTGASPVAGRFTPGTFTNQAQRGFREPRLLICTDPLADHQAIFESAYVNVPVIAFCNTDARLKYVDIAIPCNTRSVYAIGLMWWLLTREVMRLKGQLSRAEPWSVLPDLYFYRAPEEVAKEEQALVAAQAAVREAEAAEGVAQRMAAVKLVDDLLELDDERLPAERVAAKVPAAGGGAKAEEEQWPDAFKVVDWNEEVQVAGEADRARQVVAATWGAENGVF